MVLVHVNLWNGDVQDQIDQLISFIQIVLALFHMAFIDATLLGRVSQIYDGLEPSIEHLGFMDLIDPELDHVQVIGVED